MSTLQGINKTYHLVGVTDERTTCDLCGKTNLKSTVVLKDTVLDDFVFFGTDCAGRALTWTDKPSKKVTKTSIEQEIIRAAYATYNEALKNHPLTIEAARIFKTIQPYSLRARRESPRISALQQYVWNLEAVVREELHDINPTIKFGYY